MRSLPLCFLIAAAPAFAQNPHDAVAGAQRYLTVCTACHGADGDGVPGVDLGHNRFRHATSDAELVKIIRNGLPGTGMPANNLTEVAAESVVAYLHQMADNAAAAPNVKGDRANGQALFSGKGQCANCHRINGSGSRVGPDLSEIGRYRRSAAIEASILDGDAEVALPNRFVRVTTKSGETITGRLLNHDTFTLQMMDSHEQLRSFELAEVREWAFAERSTMPSYRGKLSDKELADITAYLSSLRGNR